LVSGTVPSTIARTSVAAEWCAAAVVAQLVTGPVNAAQDCKAVVDEWPKPLAVRLRPSSVHAGQSKALCAHPSAALVALRWVKGHLSEDAAVGAQAKRDARGNDLGDNEADLAMSRHLQPPDWLRARVDREVKDVKAVILHAASILHLWPKASKDELAAARPARAARARRTVERAHQWVCVEGRWQCRLCLASTFSDEGKQRRSKEECHGDAEGLRRVFLSGGGHLLMVADIDGGPCTFCAACGSWCTSKPRDLLLPCVGRRGRTAAGLAALVKFRKGFVPDCGDRCGRRVHAVEALHGGANELWAGVPLAERSCWVLRHASTMRAASEPPAREDKQPRKREESSERTQAFLASLTDSPFDRAFAAAIARRMGRQTQG